MMAMRVDAVNVQPVNYVTYPANVSPVKNVTEAPRSGIRPQDLNNLLRSMVNSKTATAMKLVSIAYNEKAQVKSTLTESLPELFVGNRLDERA
jgi:hypothetical protein